MQTVILMSNFTGKLTGMDLKQAQFKALFLKRFLNARREKKSILTQLFLPLTVLLCGLLINAATSSTKDMPSLALDLSIMSEPGTKTYALVADYRTGQPRNWTKWTKVRSFKIYPFQFRSF